MERFGSKTDGGRAVPFFTYQSPPPLSCSCPRFLIPDIKVIKTKKKKKSLKLGVSSEFKHYFTKPACKVELATENQINRAPKPFLLK